MKVIAHRGACTEALENSWSAFYNAIEAGSDRIELDINLTKDNELLIMHDCDLLRTANCELRVVNSERKFIENNIKLKNGENIPFLDEVFEQLLEKVEINVEIKSFGEKTVQALAKLIRGQPLAQKIIVSSFDLKTCEILTKEYPDIKVALLWDRSLYWPWSFHLGPKLFLQKNSIRIFHPEARLVTKSMVHNIKELGWQIFPYVGIADETKRIELWTYLKTLEVDGLCTNYPRQMKLWLKEARDDHLRFTSLSRLADG